MIHEHTPTCTFAWNKTRLGCSHFISCLVATFHSAILLSSPPVASISSQGEKLQVRMELPLGWLIVATGWPVVASHMMHLPSVEHDASTAASKARQNQILVIISKMHNLWLLSAFPRKMHGQYHYMEKNYWQYFTDINLVNKARTVNAHVPVHDGRWKLQSQICQTRAYTYIRSCWRRSRALGRNV